MLLFYHLSSPSLTCHFSLPIMSLFFPVYDFLKASICSVFLEFMFVISITSIVGFLFSICDKLDAYDVYTPG
ncbi:hypothetical protein Lalb_Chr18g0052891 [Lupinus albus]|uniref:Uncharacterized protein n=1 Tax=Lupinus albus TaxID=3870 RepID=A0A6A4NYE0_LUPAL|nr:hypothetical protein Lalb_Chr18g0052891 [Lupinus albus]